MKSFRLHSDHEVLVYRHTATQWHAISDVCAHKEASLHKGDIEDLPSCHLSSRDDKSKPPGLCVKCPKHRKKFGGGLYFSLEDGASFIPGPSEKYTESFRVPVFDVQVRGDDVYVSRDPKNTSANFAPAHDEFEAVLDSITPINHDSSVFVFRFDPATAKHPFPTVEDWPVAWHVHLRVAAIAVSREYTPTSTAVDFEKGRIVFVIKVYHQGKMTLHLSQLSKGAKVLLSQPKPTVSTSLLSRVPGTLRPLLLVGGGTGIVPLLQIAREVNGRSRIVILDSNHTEADILLRSELDEVVKSSSGRTQVVHTLTRHAEHDWTGHHGRISEKLILTAIEFLQQQAGDEEGVGSEILALVAGPRGFFETVSKLLVESGISRAHVVELES
jgi:NAD(P)H-flavin reductase/nitrite reductase/ring-hydroxylating ferredoxin subunit